MARFQVNWSNGQKSFAPLDKEAETILEKMRVVIVGLPGLVTPDTVIQRALEKKLMEPKELAEFLVCDWYSGAAQNAPPQLQFLSQMLEEGMKIGLSIDEERRRAETRAAKRRSDPSRLNPLRPL